MWQKRWRESSTTDSTTSRKPGTGCALIKQDSVRIDHAKTRSCASHSDGYQATKPKKIVLALLDYCKAFDHVWREDLLIRGIDKDLRDFLSNRKAKVQINRDRGRQLPLRRSFSCCTSTTFGESYPKTWRWPCSLTMFHSSAVIPIKKSYRKL